jgi:hypothetical protein
MGYFKTFCICWRPGVQDLSLLHSVQTDSGAHPTSYSMGTGGSFPGGKVVKLITHLHLLLRSRILELYLHSLICLNDIVLN